MDTSEEYIKMCEKATEIQKQWVPQMGDFFQGRWADNTTHIHCVNYGYKLDGDGFFVAMTGREPDMNYEYYTYPQYNCVWLPRQDQLQEIMNIEYDMLVYEFVEYLCGDTGGHGGNRFADEHVYGKFNSYEQLWLAFVMEEKYNKVWNGEDWVIPDG